ncbi:acyltransferase family protein [Cellulomonas marina]|uniref:acyltransferase family protein n=1 Tax=Cellulomonas marina TaxID=988821 RepID=UPI001587D3F8|nr:acyltransferase family protein [Cellulomonas marina]GIG29392.1 hypothetical protein Cma02nite_19920 [Cellulomonas marina]
MTAGGGARVGWVDVAKGASVVLVVLHHVLAQLVALGLAPAVLVETSRLLGTVRMPLFFLASGLFVGRALAGPWGRLLRRRVAPLLWIYVVWVLVRYVVFSLLAHGVGVAAWPPVGVVAAQLVQPASALWFVYALALFTVVARALRRVPAGVRLALAAGLSAVVGSGVVEVESYAWRSMATYAVFFLVGADLSEGVRRAAAALDARGTVVAAAVGAVLGGGALVLADLVRDSDLALDEVPGVRLGVSVLAVAGGVALAVAAARTRAGGRLQAFGTRTLDVYLVHGLVVGVVLHAAGPWLGQVVSGGSVAAGLALAVLVTAGAVLASLSAGRGLRRCGAGWLFRLPEHVAVPAVLRVRRGAGRVAAAGSAEVSLATIR